MNSRLACTVLATTLLVGGAARTAAAQAALDDDEDVAPAPTTSSEPDPSHQTRIGLGLRVRQQFVPRGLIELFVERANGGSSQTGLGFELSRRKGDFEVQFAMEWDNIYVPPGYWIDKGDMIPQDEPDFVEFDDNGYLSWNTFGWLTAEVSFMNHTEIAKQFSLRYGGGAGIAIVKGHINKTDSSCTSSDLNSCSEYGQRDQYNTPPVFLIVNAVIGVQIRPVDKVFINIEGGLHSAPFIGLTAGAYL